LHVFVLDTGCLLVYLPFLFQCGWRKGCLITWAEQHFGRKNCACQRRPLAIPRSIILFPCHWLSFVWILLPLLHERWLDRTGLVTHTEHGWAHLSLARTLFPRLQLGLYMLVLNTCSVLNIRQYDKFLQSQMCGNTYKKCQFSFPRSLSPMLSFYFTSLVCLFTYMSGECLAAYLRTSRECFWLPFLDCVCIVWIFPSWMSIQSTIFSKMPSFSNPYWCPVLNHSYLQNYPSIVTTISVCTLLHVILVLRSHAIFHGTSLSVNSFETT